MTECCKTEIWKKVGNGFFIPIGEQPPRMYPVVRKQLPDGNQIGFLVARNAGGSFQIDLVISRDDTDEMARPVTTKHECLENRSNIFAELFGHVSRGQMLLIHPIRDQFVGDFGSVEQTGRIGLFYFDVPMFHSAESSSIRIGKNNNF